MSPDVYLKQGLILSVICAAAIGTTMWLAGSLRRAERDGPPPPRPVLFGENPPTPPVVSAPQPAADGALKIELLGLTPSLINQLLRTGDVKLVAVHGDSVKIHDGLTWRPLSGGAAQRYFDLPSKTIADLDAVPPEPGANLGIVFVGVLAQQLDALTADTPRGVIRLAVEERSGKVKMRRWP